MSLTSLSFFISSFLFFPIQCGDWENWVFHRYIHWLSTIERRRSCRRTKYCLPASCRQGWYGPNQRAVWICAPCSVPVREQTFTRNCRVTPKIYQSVNLSPGDSSNYLPRAPRGAPCNGRGGSKASLRHWLWKIWQHERLPAFVYRTAFVGIPPVILKVLCWWRHDSPLAAWGGFCSVCVASPPHRIDVCDIQRLEELLTLSCV